MRKGQRRDGSQEQPCPRTEGLAWLALPGPEQTREQRDQAIQILGELLARAATQSEDSGKKAAA